MLPFATMWRLHAGHKRHWGSRKGGGAVCPDLEEWCWKHCMVETWLGSRGIEDTEVSATLPGLRSHHM